MPARLSRQLKLMSYWTMVAVVLIHAYNYTDTFLQPATRIAEGLRPGAVIEFFFSNALTRFATPVFFIISGYLFFAGVQKLTASLYVRKIKSRVISLAVPYVFWVLLWSAAGMLLLGLFGSEGFPLLVEKLSGWPEGAFEGFYNLPLPFQFWYVKDLLKLALMSPLIYLLAKKLKKYAVVLLALPWLMDFSVPHLPNTEGLLFFTLGAVLAVCGDEWGLTAETRQQPRKAALCFPACWIAACAAYALMSATAAETNVSDVVLTLMYRLCVILGVVSVFVLYEFLPQRIRTMDSARLPASTFLLFAVHEPLQHLVFQGVLLTERLDAVHLLLYFGLPTAMMLLCSGLSRLLKRFAPDFRSFVTGGR